MLASTPSFKFIKDAAGKWCDPNKLTQAQLYTEIMECGIPLLNLIAKIARGFQTGNPTASLAKALGTAACDAGKVIIHTGMGTRPIPLNFMFCLVGPSGLGKGMTLDTPMTVVHPMGGYRNVTPASGEALIAEFFDEVPTADGKGKETVRHYDPVVAHWNEIDAFAAKAGNSNSTLDGVLRSLFSGERVGDSSISRMKAGIGCILEENSYRFVMYVGSQPDHAGVLLEDATGGTLQRLLWFQLADPDAPECDEDEDDDDVPNEVDLHKAEVERILGHPAGHLDNRSAPAINVWGPSNGVIISKQISRILRAQRSRALRASKDLDPLDGHANNLRIRLAAIFAGWRAGQGNLAVVDREAWHWAGCVTALSRITREMCVESAAAQKTVNAQDAGKSDAERFMAREATIDYLKEKDVADAEAKIIENATKIIGASTWLKKPRPDPSKPATGTELYGALSKKQQKHYKEALKRATDSGALTPVEDGKVARYAPESKASNLFNTVVNGAA